MIPKLLIVDDHEVVRVGLRELLQADDYEIVGAVGSVAEAVELSNSVQPDLILLDVRMVEVDGIAGIALLREVCPEARYVMISSYENPTYVARSVALGASDYVLKGDSRDELLLALRHASLQVTPPAEGMFGKVRDTMRKSGMSTDDPELPLTAREMQVLRHVALGLSNKEIALSLQISVETVKEHVQNILRKWSVSDRTDAAVQAVKLGVV
ncbi:Response regulator protein VraR [Roseimaritima multifibrata]|uniref:Response regulator protein VraR n=1 Tax=Roseimaritima multifibrata TaxID=1930274 RepID=A0A517MN61_9BACT|nr:response regulator transcription factor [Roseimaritima multifibrata]QDS96323.1 Response regulator protein VraR [Roseimaritima multifibrata]